MYSMKKDMLSNFPVLALASFVIPSFLAFDHHVCGIFSFRLQLLQSLFTSVIITAKGFMWLLLIVLICFKLLSLFAFLPIVSLCYTVISLRQNLFHLNSLQSYGTA